MANATIQRLIMTDLHSPVQDFLHGDWSGRSSVDDAFIIFNRNENTLSVEHRPEFLDHIVDFLLEVGLEV